MNVEKVPGAFVLHHALTPTECNDMIDACEREGFGDFSVGKNHHGALQILISQPTAMELFERLKPFVDSLRIRHGEEEEERHYDMVGINRRWRVYRYEPGGIQQFGPHIDAGFPPSSLSSDGTHLIWDATSHSDTWEEYPPGTVSRLTILLYLNDDFEGGHTNFYPPVYHALKGEGHSNHHQWTRNDVMVSVQPQTGMILLFPQAVGEEEVEMARIHWSLHEGSPVESGTRPKYVIRSDVLFVESQERLATIT